MPSGKNINLYLIDGDSSGRIKCTIANWTGVAYKIPRTELEKCKNREDLKQSGVYFLFGTSEQAETPVVYIGQAGVRKNGEGILSRLLEHKRSPEKDYWTEAITFITSNNSFGPTEISYLENRFYNLALHAHRCQVKNNNDPSPGHITEEKESELEEFIDYAKLILGTLGHKILVPLSQHPESSASPLSATPQETTLYLTRTIKQYGLTVKASGKQTPEGFVVFRGSIISPNDDDTIPLSVKEKRKDAAIDENHILAEDVLLGSPSSAAMFVIGKSANGWTAWKTADKKTLRRLEQNE